MKVYAVCIEDHPTHICWTHEDALLRLEGINRSFPDTRTWIDQVEIDEISVPVVHYYQYRGYGFPNANQAFKFLVSEMGELADAYVNGEAEWVRNNPKNKTSDPYPEVGDVLQMLAMFGLKLQPPVNPIEAMFEKWKSKGFEI
jgi:hypothetical protein